MGGLSALFRTRDRYGHDPFMVGNGRPAGQTQRNTLSVRLALLLLAHAPTRQIARRSGLAADNRARTRTR